ncbi:hypothetical protein ACFC5Z_40065 [Streptomyces sp. NPDC056004]|uniref:hypothetical protein n=1 Tax=Streptomyces sp. NPDC056004 TaxID=3345677 RepID=UPI0035DFC15A
MTADTHEAVLGAFGSIRRQQQEAERETTRQIREYVTAGAGAGVPASAVHRLTGIRSDTVDRWRVEHHAEHHVPRARAQAFAPIPKPKETGKAAGSAVAAAASAVPPVPATVDRVLDVVTAADRPVRQKDIAEVSRLNKGTVSKAVTRLAREGRLVRLDDGTVTLGVPAAPVPNRSQL